LAGLVLGGTGTIRAQQTSENAAIALQGKGGCTTRSVQLGPNWHAEYVCDAPIKITTVSTDGSPALVLCDTTANTPPGNGTAPMSTSGTSNPVAKAGSYALEVVTTGTWQVTLFDAGYTKNINIAGALPYTPGGAPTPAVTQTMPGMYPGMNPVMQRRRMIAQLHGVNDVDKTEPFVVNNGWHVQWIMSSPSFKITLVPTDGSAPTVLADTTSTDGSTGGLDSPAPSTSPTPQANPNGISPYGTIMANRHVGSTDEATGGTFNLQVETKGSWAVFVSENLATELASADSTTGTPGASTPAPPATPAAPVKLTDDQQRAVVLITGDNGQGTGFLVKMPDGPAVVTNIHVISNNPNLKVKNSAGVLIPVLSIKGAADRDLALLSIKDDGYSYLDVCPDISKAVQTGDEVVTPGNSEGGEVMLNTGGKILGIGPQKVEIDNPIYHGNSGGPIFLTKSNQVVGVVTEAIKVRITNALDQASFANHNSAIANSMRYFGMRLDNVPSWVPIDSNRLQNEGAFLDDFHHLSKCLDSYLNSSDKDNSEFSSFYKSEDQIMKANDHFRQNVTGSDTSQRIEALKGLLFELQGIADKNMDQVQNMNNFYSFNQVRAQEEIEYRKALKDELDKIGNDVGRLNGAVRSNN
jgi:S1-C subfamily serine protease